MASLNRVQLIGHLGGDPDVRYLPDGSAVANISIATTAVWNNAVGEKQEQTEWHKVTFFKKLAEVAAEYLKKGMQVYVEGRLQTDKWKDREGVDRYTTKIIGDRMLMLGKRPDGEPENKTAPAEPRQKRDAPKKQAATAGGGASFDDMTDDIPF